MNRLMLLAFSFVALLLVALPAHAESSKEPPDLSILFHAEFGTLRLLGDAGEDSSWSFGAHLRQGVAFGPLITWLRIGGQAWLTTQDAPPLQRGMRSFDTGLGMGARHAFGHLQLSAFASYTMTNISGNPLTDSIGTRTRYHTLGGGAAAGWLGFAPLYGEVRAEVHHWLATEKPVQSVQILFSIGIQMSLRN